MAVDVLCWCVDVLAIVLVVWCGVLMLMLCVGVLIVLMIVLGLCWGIDVDV
jgi:hypothetical protein